MKIKFVCDVFSKTLISPATPYLVATSINENSSISPQQEGYTRFFFDVDFPDHLFYEIKRENLEQEIKAIKEK